jgi:hypothetical protein
VVGPYGVLFSIAVNPAKVGFGAQDTVIVEQRADTVVGPDGEFFGVVLRKTAGQIRPVASARLAWFESAWTPKIIMPKRGSSVLPALKRQ